MTYLHKKKYFTLVIGTSLLASSFILYFFLLSFIQQQIEQTLPIVNTTKSRTYSNWKEIPFPIYNYVYLFNITNPVEVLNLKAKPILQQLGPYAFIERRIKTNVSWSQGATDDPHETVTYQVQRSWQFAPELTVGSLNDVVYHINVPLISAANQIKQNGGSGFEYAGLNLLTTFTGSKMLAKHTVGELLFDGYSDSLLTAARRFGVKVPYDKFGWFYGRNNTSSDGVFRAYTGSTTLARIGKLYSWNGQRKSKLWSTETCNQIDGATASGDMFPPFQSPSPDHIKLFVGEICRPLKMSFEQEDSVFGVQVNKYSVKGSTLDYDLEENLCYCPNGHCPPRGIMNTSTCQHGAPVGVSMPHFLYGEKSLFDKISGLEPDPLKHNFYVDIEPALGIPVRIAVRMQINVVVEDNVNVGALSGLRDKQVIYPTLWFDVRAQMSEEAAQEIRIVQNLPLYVNLMAIATLVVAAIFLVFFCRIYQRSQSKPRIPSEKEYTSLQIIATES